MAQAMDLFMGTDTHRTPADRLSDYLRRHFSSKDGYATKRLSSAIGCTPKAAENLLDGHWPNARHWQRIAILFGQDVLDSVFGPDINETVARLKREEAELEKLLAEKRARRLQAQGFVDRSPEPLEASEAQPLADNITAFGRRRP
jgi:hypothetical protein